MKHYGTVKGRQYREEQPKPTYQQLGKKRCTKCGETKPIYEFDKHRTHGINYRRPTCKACRSKEAKERYQRRKRG